MKQFKLILLLTRGSQSLYEPSKLSKHFVDLIEVDGEHHVILSNSIMDEFKKAVQFYELYEKEISKLDSFRNRVNDFESFTDDESSRLSDAYYDFKDIPDTYYDIKDIRTNADIIKNYYIPRPSVLDFSLTQGKKKEVLICEVFLVHKATNEVSQKTILQFSGFEWRLVL